jgi:hypothetical protein
MDTLAVNPLGPASLSALYGVQALQTSLPQAAQATQAGNPPASALSTQELLQNLFQQTLQAATPYPATTPASLNTNLSQDATTSLLAALTAPQAPADTTPTVDSTTNPAATQTSTVTPSSPPAVNHQDLPAAQDAFATSLNPDFAMQTALRFGAGVTIQAAATAIPGAHLGTDLVRDATSVLRLGNLQPQAGHPGAEAFAKPQYASQRIVHTYEVASTTPTTQGTGTVDLLA